METLERTDPVEARRFRYAQYRGQRSTLVLNGIAITGDVQSVMEDRPSKRIMPILTIQASKNGEFVETPRSDCMIAVTQARMLLEAGWQVHIADAAGRQFQPSEFGELLMNEREL